MKKFITAVLALALAASLGGTAFAAENSATNTGAEDTGINVSAELIPGLKAGRTVSVDIAWDAMDFTYTEGNRGTWNPAGHKYEDAAAGSWAWDYKTAEKAAPVITLTNHSDLKVDASFSFASGVEGLIGSFTENGFTLDSAVGTEPNHAPQANTSFSVSGSGIDESHTLGALTVSIQKTASVSVSTEAELREALKNIPNIILAQDITLSEDLALNPDNTADNCVIDLNGKTLSYGGSQYDVIWTKNIHITIKNGTIHHTQPSAYGVLAGPGSVVTLDNCTIETVSDYALVANSATVYINDCTLNAGSYSSGVMRVKNYSGGNEASATLSGKIALLNTESTLINLVSGTVTCLAGTYNFDPSDYVNAESFTVTDNADGTWTAAAK